MLDFTNENKADAQIVWCFDANWIGSPSDRRSTSRYCIWCWR